MKRFFVSLVSVMLTILLPASTYAITEEEMYFYAQNGIYFMTLGSNCGMTTGNNFNYAGAQIFSDAELGTIAANQPFYEEAASQYGFPWQILAVLHRREHSLLRDNPGNGQGIYQLYSYTAGGTNANRFEPGPVDDAEFQRQTNLAAELVANSYGAGLDLGADDGVKTMFYRYNGTGGGAYARQAMALGFSAEEAAHGEGSPYVMNRFDLERDPTVEPTASNGTWGMIKTDRGAMEYPANNEFGAFVMYMALGGSSAYCNSGDLVSGGLALEEAQNIMAYYKEKAVEHRNAPHGSIISLDGANLKSLCSDGPLANCVAFSQWFIAKYTSAGNIGLPDGKDVVRTLINNGFEDGGNVPRAYAVFSRASGGDGHGHTGVVFSVDEAAGTIVIGEAGCGGGINFIGAKQERLDKYTTSDYTYAYTDTKLIGL